MSRPVFRLLTVAAVATAAVGLTALPALAHVTVNSPGATQGSFGVVTFRMPNELDNANATELKVQLPADQPLASVAVKPEPGWSYTITRAKLSTPIKDDDGNEVTDYISVIDWKATAGGIKPGEYQDFDLSVGPLPKADSMTFKAIQTYSNGQIVPWIDVPAPGSTAEPDHPAPTLKLAPAGAATTNTTTAPAPAAAASNDNAASKGSVTGAYVIGGIGLVAGLAALALALTGRRRRSTVEKKSPKQDFTSTGAH